MGIIEFKMILIGQDKEEGEVNEKTDALETLSRALRRRKAA